MYLSRVFLDDSKRATVIALACPSKFHGAIESSFAGGRPHTLWRLDYIYGKYCLLILSETLPDFENLISQYGMKDVPAETKSYDSLLNRITDEGKWHFRLTANPTYTVKQDEKKNRGVIYAHRTPEHQKQWLIKQSNKYGFSVNEDEFSVVSSQWVRFKKGNESRKTVSFIAATFEGVLTIEDSEKFIYLLTHGIGREKTYGMGLMTIVR